MIKLLNRMLRIRLATKHFLFLLAGSLLVFGILVYVLLTNAEKLIREQTILDSEVVLKRTNDYLNIYLESVQNVLLQVSARKDLFDLANETEISNALQQYAATNSSVINAIFIVKPDGSVFSNMQLYYNILGNDKLPNMFELAQGNYGGINWSEPYWSPLSQNTIAFVRPVTNSRGEDSGIVVVEINLNEITTRLSNLNESELQTFTVLSAGGKFVAGKRDSKLLPYSNHVYPAELPPDFTGQLQELRSGTSEIDGPTGRLVVVKSSTNRLGWSLISYFDEAYFYRNIGKLYTSVGNIALLWLLILLAGAWILGRTFTNPIKTLVSKMDRVHNIDVPSYINIRRSDEIGDLARSYNSLMERISILSKDIVHIENQKRSYEIRTLQSQIGPHFLYNTLACISSLNLQNKNEQVQQTINSLVGLLSLSMGKESPLNTLEEEIRGIKLFTDIQNVRYGDLITLNIRVEEGTAHCLLPRLSLQPLIENAIFHGIVPTRRAGEIRIRVQKTTRGLRIYIRDNGTGLDSKTYRELMQERRTEAENHQLSGLGLYNVHHRLALYFGEEYGLKVDGKKHCGTIICVKIPYDKKKALPEYESRITNDFRRTYF